MINENLRRFDAHEAPKKEPEKISKFLVILSALATVWTLGFLVWVLSL
jgi:hypothetical protein